MAIVRTITGALRVDRLRPYGTDVLAGPEQIVITDEANRSYEFNGQFNYDQNGPHGTVESVSYFIDGRLNFTVEGLAVPIEPLVSPETTIYDAIQIVLAGEDTVLGRNRDDVLAAGGGADRVLGKGGNDTLFGEAGDDTLFGGDDSDVLIGGAGADRLRGEAGADLFFYVSADESTAAAAGRDRILDFNSSEFDKIDLRSIDGNLQTELRVVEAFTNTAGELTISAKAGGTFLVLADLDGNGRADFGLTVTSTSETPSLTANDFLL